MSQFHTDEYVDFLYKITPDNAHQFAKEQVKCAYSHLAICPMLTIDNVGDDCPIFDGLFEYCSISAGGSMGTRLMCKIARLTSQRERPDCLETNATSRSTGLEACIMQRRRRPAASVM